MPENKSVAFDLSALGDTLEQQINAVSSEKPFLENLTKATLKEFALNRQLDIRENREKENNIVKKFYAITLRLKVEYEHEVDGETQTYVSYDNYGGLRAYPKVDEHNEPIMDEPENVQPEIPVFQNDSSYLPSYKMNKNAMFREMQMEMNKMFIEQMKMMRQQIKNQDRKRLKLKNKSQMVYDILSSVARDSEKEQPTPEPAPEPEDKHDEEEEHEETSSPDSFANSYKNTQPVKPPEPEVHVPQPEPKVYQQPYEQDIDQIDGTYYKPISRRDRLNFKNFNI